MSTCYHRGMVAWLRSALAAALLACSPVPSDQALYQRALVEAEDHTRALAACQQITAPGLAGDCQVAIMERFSHLAPEDCATIASDLWRDECVFLLAERQWRSGAHAEGLATCRETRFARACTWHLIQDEAEAAAGEEPGVAEARLSAFLTSRIAPDAALHFWKLWLRARLSAGSPIDEQSCEGLTSREDCREAVGRTLHELLEATGRRDRESLCAAAPGERVMVSSGPAWRLGELTRTAEQQWVDRHCP